MTDWRAGELAAIGGAEEIQIAPDGGDGARGRAATIWVVRVGDKLYVRARTEWVSVSEVESGDSRE